MTAPPTVRARRVLRRVERPVRDGDEIVTAFRDGRVTLRSFRRSDGFTNADKEIGYHGVEPGDLVVHAMDGFAGAIGVSDSRGKMSPVAHTWRVNAGDERYVAYVLRSFAWSGRIASLGKGIRERSTSFDPAILLELDLPWPAHSEQADIADFLDDQLADINIAIEEARRLAAGATAAASNRLRELVGNDAMPSVPLSSIAKIVDTEHKTAPPAVGGGHWSAGTGAIRRGRLVRERLREIDVLTYRAWTRRLEPNPGDVLLTREAPVGEAALLGSEDRGIAIGQRVVLLRASDRLVPSWLLVCLLEPGFRERVNELTSGSLHPHLNMADIARLRIPVPDLDDQIALARRGLDIEAASRELGASVDLMVRLLEERKRAVVAACVAADFGALATMNRTRRCSRARTDAP